MSYGLFVHFLFSKHKRVKHHRVEEYYPNISEDEDSKRIQGCNEEKFCSISVVLARLDTGTGG